MHLVGLCVALLLYFIWWLCDDGSRYLCPRCGASLRPYVKSCRYCRARFKVQPMTQTSQGRAWNGPAKRPLPKQQTGLPDPATLKALFRLPERGLDETPISREQKWELKSLGATDSDAIEVLGSEQARYLIRFRKALTESERQEKVATKTPFLLRWYVLWPAAAAICAFSVWMATRGNDMPVPVADVPVTQLPDAPAIRASSSPSHAASPTVADWTPKPTDWSAALPSPSAPDLRSDSPIGTGTQQGGNVPPVNENARHRSEHAAAVAASKARAIQRYPALAVAGSHFNTAFVARYEALARLHSPRLEAPDWPEKLAAECAASIPVEFQ